MNLEQALFQRGHRVSGRGGFQDIFVPPNLDEESTRVYANLLYLLMSDVSFRKNLRDWTSPKKSPDVVCGVKVRSYLYLLNSQDGPGSHRVCQSRYSKTFEWFVSELLKREFGAKASGFSLTLRDAPSDDFDCVALFDEGLSFVECKTGNDSIHSEIKKFMRRDAQLMARYSFLIVDRDGPFGKREGSLPFTRDEAKESGIREVNHFHGEGYDFYRIAGREDTRRFLLTCSATTVDLSENIRHMIRYTNMVHDEHFDLTTEYPVEVMQFMPDDEVGSMIN